MGLVVELGSVLEPRGNGPRGEDIVVDVEVPKAALGHPAGYRAEIARAQSIAGERVYRVLHPSDGEWVTLRLPADFPPGAAVRLPEQGAPRENGKPGDLLVRVHPVDQPWGGGGETATIPASLWWWLLTAGCGVVWAVLG